MFSDASFRHKLVPKATQSRVYGGGHAFVHREKVNIVRCLESLEIDLANLSCS